MEEATEQIITEETPLGITIKVPTIEFPSELFFTLLKIAEDLRYLSQGLSLNLSHLQELEENKGDIKKYLEKDLIVENKDGKEVKKLREDFWN